MSYKAGFFSRGDLRPSLFYKKKKKKKKKIQEMEAILFFKKNFAKNFFSNFKGPKIKIRMFS